MHSLHVLFICALFINSFHLFPLCLLYSLYVLFIRALYTCSFHELFLCSYSIRSNHVLFQCTLYMRSFMRYIIAQAEAIFITNK